MKTTVSEKGQITIPKKLRERLGIRPGQVIEFTEEQGRLVGRKIAATDPLDSLYGVLAGEGTTDELMDELRGPVDLP